MLRMKEFGSLAKRPTYLKVYKSCFISLLFAGLGSSSCQEGLGFQVEMRQLELELCKQLSCS